MRHRHHPLRNHRFSAAVIALSLLTASCTTLESDEAQPESGVSTSSSSAAEVDSSIASELDETPTTIADTTDPAVRVDDDLSGFGDPLFPGVGNAGYDVEHYDLQIDLTGPESDAIDGQATLTLKAQIELTHFNLDLELLTVDEVLVDDTVAEFTHVDRELQIIPATAIAAGNNALVQIRYHGVPQPLHDAGDVFELGWQTSRWGTYVVSEPTGAANWFPSNDHPGDKATFTIAITVAEGQTAAGPGELIDRSVGSNGAGASVETFIYSMRYPMATYLAAVVTGDFVIDEFSGPGGVTIRNVLHRPTADELRPILEETTVPMLTLFAELFGDYPFDNYGIVAIPEPLGFALENQTLSLFGVDTIARDSVFTDQILAHEMAHQWFGDAVSVAEWDDIWLNEGFASWADAYWLEHEGQEFFDVLDQYNQSAQLGPLKGLTAATLFEENVYVRGALTLEALHRTVGDDGFFEFLQTWVSTYSGGNASTADFLALVDGQFGEDAQQLMKAWIFDEQSPALPSR